MLRYLAAGPRRFGDTPMPLHRRMNWEFFAVVQGKCAPILGPGEPTRPVESTLWVFPPETPHGWGGAPGRVCRVVVLHFSAVPAALEDAVRERGFLARALGAGEKRFLAERARALKPHYWDPVLASEVHTTKALMELSLLFLDRPAAPRPGPRGGKLGRVLRFEAWMGERLARQPSIDDGARAAGLSPSQLRRVCQAVRQMGPTEILRRLRVERAMELMAKQDAKLTAIAAECGFASATNFCRAFKAATGTTPGLWRREVHIQYRKPSRGNAANHRAHGRRRAES